MGLAACVGSCVRGSTDVKVESDRTVAEGLLAAWMLACQTAQLSNHTGVIGPGTVLQ
jgi:hypothetical protein